MTREQARLARWVLLAVFVACPWLGKALGIPELSLLGIAALVGMIVVKVAFDRCPHCGACLGRARGGRCPRCGKPLEEEP